MLRHNIREQTALRNVLAFLLDNIGNPFSARNISGRMVSEGIKTTTATVLNYVDYFKEAFILLNASRYDIKGKALLSSTEKYYAVDLGLRNVIKKSEKLDSNKLYENIVYLEMRSRGYEVQVGKLDDTEIDFICYRGDEKLYIQVAYLITPADEEREFGNLERLHNNYPKYVISGDLVNLSRNGIIHRNIIDFLLNPLIFTSWGITVDAVVPFFLYQNWRHSYGKSIRKIICYRLQRSSGSQKVRQHGT